MVDNIYVYDGTKAGNGYNEQAEMPLFNLDDYISGCSDIHEMLVAALEEIKLAIRENNELFRFLTSYYYDSDFPDGKKRIIREQAKESRFYKALSKAQLQNKIKSGNVFRLMSVFIQSSFDIMRAYYRAEMAFPSNELFLNIIGYDDDDIRTNDRDIVKQQNSVITAFASDYNSILFVDLDNDEIDVYQAIGDNDAWIINAAQRGYNSYRERFAERFLYPEDKAWFLEQTTRENIISRLNEDPVFYIDHKIMKRGQPVSYQTKIVLDPMWASGNRILIGGHRIFDSVTGGFSKDSNIRVFG